MNFNRPLAVQILFHITTRHQSKRLHGKLFFYFTCIIIIFSVGTVRRGPGVGTISRISLFCSLHPKYKLSIKNTQPFKTFSFIENLLYNRQNVQLYSFTSYNKKRIDVQIAHSAPHTGHHEHLLQDTMNNHALFYLMYILLNRLPGSLQLNAQYNYRNCCNIY